MDENLHSIDDIFRKAINEYDDTPSAKVTENIEKHLQKKRVVSITKKYKKWKWVAAALLIFSVGMAMYTIHLRIRYKEVTSSSKAKAPSAKNHVITPAKPADNDNSTQVSNNNISGNDMSASSSSMNKAAQATSNKAAQDEYAGKLRKALPGDKAATSNHNKSSDDKKAYTQLDNAGVKTTNTKVDAGKVVESSKNNLLTNKTDKGKTITKSTAERQNTKTAIINNNDRLHNNAKREDEQAINLSLMPRITLNDYLANKTGSLLNMPPASQLQMAQTTGLSPTAIMPALVGANNSIIKAGVTKKFAANMFVSFDNVATHLTSDHPNFREDDKNKIKHDEDKSSAYTFGMLGQLSLTKKIGIEAGFSLSTITTNINAKTIYARPDNRGNVNYRISCSSGYAYVSTKYGSRPNQGDSITALSSKNIVQYFSVPAGLQYIMRFGKFELRPAFTLFTNFRTKSKVETVLSTAGNNESTATNTIEGLRPVYFDAGPRLDAIYNISRVIGIGITPSARFALSSTTKDGPVKTYLNSFGLAAAIKVNL